jgi:hypothetical protein
MVTHVQKVDARFGIAKKAFPITGTYQLQEQRQVSAEVEDTGNSRSENQETQPIAITALGIASYALFDTSVEVLKFGE